MLEENEWVALETYEDGDYDITIEGTSVGEIPEDLYETSDPDYYQVYCKGPWRLLISPTKFEPSADAINSALQLLKKSPEYLHLNARLNVLEELFTRLQNKSKEKTYCIVCGKSVKTSSHDDDCDLEQALRILNR